MFGQKSAFASPATNTFGAPQQSTPFGAPAPTNSFGAAPNVTPFGATSFGQPAQNTMGGFGAPNVAAGQTGGGLFGAASNTGQPTGGGLFGSSTANNTTAFGAAPNTGFAGASFGAGSAFNKPATGFGAGSAFGQTNPTNTGGGLFGSTAPNTSTGMFGQPAQPTNTFGATASPFGAAGGFGATNMPNGTTIKFNPTTGTDTMLKSGVTTNINIRHQCITCMKEYEAKSIEELRFDDYAANRKGGGAQTMGGMGQPTGGLFGATNPQPGIGGGGFFGSTPASTQGGSMFGQQAKPLFGGTTGFGATTSASTGFGATNTFGATSGGLFGAAKPTGFGAPTPQAGFGGGFGQPTTTSASGGLFGQQQKPAFALGGTPATSQSGGLFGSSTGGFGQTTQSAFGATNTGFGAPLQGGLGNTGGGLFGQQNKPAGFGGFGGTTTSSAPAFGGGFGTNTATQAAPFGQTKPAFGFGAPAGNAAPSFGFGTNTQQPQASGGMFGQQKPATLSFGGSTTMGQAPLGGTSFGGGFGAANNATGGGMFGTAPQNKPGGMFGSTGSTFGAPTGGAFGSTLGAPSAFGTGMAPSYGAPNLGGMMGNTQPQAPASNANAIQQRLIQLASSPYGDNPLFKNLLQDSGKREEILKPINPASQKALDSNQYKVSPHRNIKGKAKPINGLANRSAIFDGLEDDDVNTSSEMFVPRSSVKKLSLKAKSPASMPQSNGQQNQKEEKSINDTSVVSPANNQSVEESLNLPQVKARGDGSNNMSNVSVIDDSFMVLNPKKSKSKVASDKSDENNSSECSETGEDESENNPCGIRLARKGYYTMPTLAEMGTMVDAKGQCQVENFTVGRVGYGNIFFPGVTNVMGLNLDEILFIRYKEVIVYPDETKKPPQGEGLNKKAQITLDKVWPVDKTSRDNVTSPRKLAEMNYEERLQKACLKLGARFVEYRPETGSWVFKVEHFSRYGLDDSDEDEPSKEVKKIKTGVPVKTILESKNPRGDVQTTAAVVHAENTTNEEGEGPSPVSNEVARRQTRDPSAKDRSLSSDHDRSDLGTSRAVSPPAEQLARIRASAPKVMMMKAALFDDDEEFMDLSGSKASKARPVILEARKTVLDQTDSLVEDIAHSLLMGSTSQGGPSAAASLLRSRFLMDPARNESTNSMLLSTASYTPSKRIPTYTLHSAYDSYVTLPNSGSSDKVKIIIPKHIDQLPSLTRSVLANRWKVFADSGLFMSRSFRVGWFTPLRLTNIGYTPGMRGQTKPSFSQVGLEHVSTSCFGNADDVQIQSIEGWLQSNLEVSNLSFEKPGEDFPKFSSKDGVDTLHSHVFDLCEVLWGRVTEQQRYEPDSHEITMKRREGLSKWLHDAVGHLVKRNIERAKARGDHVDEVLALIEGHNVNEACEKAQSQGDHFSALLIATTGGNNTLNGQMVLQQLEKWQEMECDKHLKSNRLRLYAILAGIPTWAGTDTNVNVCQDLDWKQALAMEFWYLTSPVASIEDALLAYEDAFGGLQDNYSREPTPDYFNGQMDGRTFDVSYHLLKLYTNRSHPLESILTPATHTSDCLDYRLAWLLAKVLRSVGYNHLSKEKEDELHLSFGSQLEDLGLWHWSVFALLHLADPDHRKQTIIDTITRHVKLANEDSEVRETFLHERLSVPIPWIAEAKATKAAFMRNPKDQAYYLIKAKFWAEAHRVIVTQVAPEAIINEDYEYLMLLLSQLCSEDICSSIVDWNVQGKVFFDFISVDSDVKRLVNNQDPETLNYEIERLRPIIGSLANRISSLRTETAKERLCRAEIAKRVAHLMRAIFSLDTANKTGGDGSLGAGPSRVLAEHLSQLPLPEDYALQELRTLTRNYMMEIIES
ncbi:hypothetical protein TCAL_05590 [Tigriopus californicus]|uniref:Nuclear pore complex protein Nup98-Nup96 n=1 Tax=Tigriopus californicus TaxID=6832 RepID=A0A553NEP4_TIGCA|nr:hypothetical protein TCAL_05590 [Tigriopus californicus]